MILAPMESDAHWPILWIAILTEIVNIVFYFLGSGIMFCNDKQSKGAPKHKVCPVPGNKQLNVFGNNHNNKPFKSGLINSLFFQNNASMSQNHHY